MSEEVSRQVFMASVWNRRVAWRVSMVGWVREGERIRGPRPRELRVTLRMLGYSKVSGFAVMI